MLATLLLAGSLTIAQTDANDRQVNPLTTENNGDETSKTRYFLMKGPRRTSAVFDGHKIRSPAGRMSFTASH